MKIKKLNKKSILLALLVIGIIIIISCEKEIGIDPIPTERPIKGILVDANDNSIRVSNAIVAITPVNKNIDYNTSITTSDDEGFFEVNTLVLPSSQPYQVHIDATNNGYMLKDTIVNCDCDVLELNFIKLDKYSCGISIIPNLIEFEKSFIDIPKSNTVTISNSSALPLNITDINFSNSIFNLEQGSIVFPKYLEPGEQTTIVINFTPTDNIEYSDSIIVRTDCDENSDFIALLHGMGESSPCGIQLSPSIINLPNNFVVGDTLQYTVTITGSPEATEPVIVDSIFNPFGSNVFFNENELVGIQIQPGEEREFTIFVTSETEQSLLDSLKFYTSCDDSSYNSLIIDGKSNTRKCDIIVDGQPTKLGINQDTLIFIIKNLSDVLDLSYNVTPLDQPFNITPLPLQGTLPPLGEKLFYLTFNINSSGDSNQVLTIFTNADCKLQENLFASFSIPSLNKATIYRWIPNPENESKVLSNPDYIGWGFNLSERKQKPDSINICGSNNPNMMANNTESDFRFNYIANYFADISLNNTASISVHNQWGDLRQFKNQFGLFSFDVINYTRLLRINKDVPGYWQDGCSVPNLVSDDVFAINTIEGNIFIIRIYDISRRRDPNLNFEECRCKK